MNRADHLLNRAFSLARRSRELSPRELPFGLETAVLAEWRASRSHPSVLANAVPTLRWVALVACTLALLCSAWKRDEVAQIFHRADPETSIADSALFVGLGDE
jgi:hypothetical protein